MDADLRSLLPPRICSMRLHPRALTFIRESIAAHQHSDRTEVAHQMRERLQRLMGAGASRSPVQALLCGAFISSGGSSPLRHPSTSLPVI